MKAKQRTCKSKYIKKKVIDDLCEQLSSTFQLTPSRLDKTPQAPAERIDTPKSKHIEPSDNEALLPFVESATPKRPPTPVKFSQDWDKSLYRVNNPVSPSSSVTTFIPDFSISQINTLDSLSELKTEIETIKLILKELTANQNGENKRVQNLITRISRVEQKQFQEEKEKENLKKKIPLNADPNEWTFPKHTSKVNQIPGFGYNITTSNRFASFTEPSPASPQETAPVDLNCSREKAVNSKRNEVKRRPIICCTENHLNNFKPVRPGRASYTQAVKQGGRVQVHSDSMMQRIRKAEFYRNLKRGFGSIRCYPGAKPNHMQHYVMPHVVEDAPEVFVAHSGTNSIHDRDLTDEELAQSVVTIGINAKSLGAKKIIISGIIVTRNGMHVERRRRNVSRIIEELCQKENFVFVNNDNIRLEDIDEKDKVHLLESGSVKLANNILNAINNNL